MRRWIVNVGAVTLLAAAAVIFIVVNFGWPKYWASLFPSLFPAPAGMGALGHILSATLFAPFLVRAWAGRDSYKDRGADAFILLAIDVALIAAVVWLVMALPRAVLLATIIIAIQAAFSYQAWRRARSLRPR
jgi:hypothetical protein